MAKKDNSMLILGGIAILILAIGGGYIQLPQAIMAVDDQQVPTGVGGVQVNVGTPTLEWYAKNAMTNAPISSVGSGYRVSVNGTITDELSTSTADVSLGDAYTVCVLPNGTYYAACSSGTIASTVTKVTIPLYAWATTVPTVWVNNDGENSTRRNSATAPDTLAAGDTDVGELCVQGGSALQSFGDGKFLVGLDYNTAVRVGSPIWAAPSATIYTGGIPTGYDPGDINAMNNAVVFYEVNSTLDNTKTICGSLTIVNAATDQDAGVSPSTGIQILDHAGFTHSVTGELVFGYKRPTSGADTNTSIDQNAQYHLG